MRVQVLVDPSALRSFERDVKRLGEAPRKAGRRFLDRWGRKVAAKAKPLTPVSPEDGGELRESVRSSRASMPQSGRGSVAVMAGGKKLESLIADPKRAAVYPNIQHEDPTIRHTTGQSKFIEKPFFASLPEVVPGIDAEMRRAGVR